LYVLASFSCILFIINFFKTTTYSLYINMLLCFLALIIIP
jgi:hypothetical protein